MKDPFNRSESSQDKISLFPVSMEELEKLFRRCIRAEMNERFSNPLNESNDILDSNDICREFNISLPTLIKYRKSGMIPFFKIGCRLRYKKNDVEAALKKMDW